MAEYLVLIYEDESAWDKADPATMGQVLEEHQMHGAELQRTARRQRTPADEHGYLATQGPLGEFHDHRRGVR